MAETTSGAEALSPAAWVVLIVVPLSGLYLLSIVLRRTWATLHGWAQKIWSKNAAKKPRKQAQPAQRTPGRARQQGTDTPGKSLKSLVKASTGGRHGGGHDPTPESDLFCTTLRSAGGTLTGIAWSSDGSTLAAVLEGTGVQVWTIPAGRDVAARGRAPLPSTTIEWPQEVVDVAFAGQGRRLAALTYGFGGAAELVILDLGGKPGADKKPAVAWRCEKAHPAGARPRWLKASADSRGGMAVLVSSSNRTDLKVYSSKGGVLGSIDTGGFENYDVSVSRDGRWIAAATFTNDVKLFEVAFDGHGAFQGLPKATPLAGHTGRVWTLDFAPDLTRCATASADGTLRTWDLAVRFALREKPRPLVVAELPAALKDGSAHPLRLSWGPAGVIAAAKGTALAFFDEGTGDVLEVVEDAHLAPISALAWGPSKIKALEVDVWPLATAGLDGRVRLWRPPQRAPKARPAAA